VKRKTLLQACLSVVAVAFQNIFRAKIHQNNFFIF